MTLLGSHTEEDRDTSSLVPWESPLHEFGMPVYWVLECSSVVIKECSVMVWGI